MAPEVTYCGNGISRDGSYAAVAEMEELYEKVLAETGERPIGEATLVQDLQQGATTLGLPPDLAPDAANLQVTRWGIVWPHLDGLEPAEKAHLDALRGALDELIALRSKQSGIAKPYDLIYTPGQDLLTFLDGYGVGTHELKPTTVPYYLTIVASPGQIPWSFQQDLDMDYAVGRLWFDDVDDCRAYVAHLLAYERAACAPTAQEALFVGTQHTDDPVTQGTATVLLPGLVDWVDQHPLLGFGATSMVGASTGGGARRDKVMGRLSGVGIDGQPKDRPAFLFTAMHGMEAHKTDADQTEVQGALICQDWPGLYSEVQPAHYVCGEDVSGLDLAGMVAFCYTCFGAGTPLKPDWRKKPLLGQLPDLAKAPFVARLPQKMLAGGALGFLGHVSRAWDRSYLGLRQAKPQDQIFTVTMGEILRGKPVGHATDWLNERWMRLTALLDCESRVRSLSKAHTVELWLTRNDLRGYVLLGDPAARLRRELWD